MPINRLLIACPLSLKTAFKAYTREIQVTIADDRTHLYDIIQLVPALQLIQA